ncbi:hypothetical protein BV25DRAFT_1947703, partial [Artomyces pyxidatus]
MHNYTQLGSVENLAGNSANSSYGPEFAGATLGSVLSAVLGPAGFELKKCLPMNQERAADKYVTKALKLLWVHVDLFEDAQWRDLKILWNDVVQERRVLRELVNPDSTWICRIWEIVRKPEAAKYLYIAKEAYRATLSASEGAQLEHIFRTNSHGERIRRAGPEIDRVIGTIVLSKGKDVELQISRDNPDVLARVLHAMTEARTNSQESDGPESYHSVNSRTLKPSGVIEPSDSSMARASTLPLTPVVNNPIAPLKTLEVELPAAVRGTSHVQPPGLDSGAEMLVETLIIPPVVPCSALQDVQTIPDRESSIVREVGGDRVMHEESAPQPVAQSIGAALDQLCTLEDDLRDAQRGFQNLQDLQDASERQVRRLADDLTRSRKERDQLRALVNERDERLERTRDEGDKQVDDLESLTVELYLTQKSVQELEVQLRDTTSQLELITENQRRTLDRCDEAERARDEVTAKLKEAEEGQGLAEEGQRQALKMLEEAEKK